MEFTWLHGLIYGLMCGYSQFLPVSSEAHRVLFLQLSGFTDEGSHIRLSVWIGSLLAVVISCWTQIARMRREKHLASIPPRRRKRQPDKKILMDTRVFKMAIVPLIISMLAVPFTQSVIGIRFWLVAFMAVIQGVILYSPQFMPGANKDSLSLSGWDSFLIGLGGTLGVIPGFSRVGMLTAVGSVRGADKRYILEMSLLLCIPVIVILCLMEFFTMAFAGTATITVSMLSCAVAAAGACISSLGAIHLMRYMVKSAGFAGFAFYSWGLALTIFVLYLTV